MNRRIDPVELQFLKERTALSKLFENYGVRSKGSPKARWANCCFHGEKTPSLKINDQRGSYKCFGCGVSGDHFTLLQEYGGKTFQEAVEALGGSDQLITTEEREAIELRHVEWREQEKKEKEDARKACDRLFQNGRFIAGTHVEAYLRDGRGLPVVPSWTFDLRYVPELQYCGYLDADAEETTVLGTFPAMIAAIRDAKGVLIGVHRTYLDTKLAKKLTPPGDASRNKAKKVLGEQQGGMIRLSPMGSRLAIGEGIETSRSWFTLGIWEGDIAVAAAVSLGNLSGSATGSSPHPRSDKKMVPNGIPDVDRPGLILPREVEEVILIGDSDSEPCMTRARLLVAARRFRQQGRTVFVSMAPDGKDFSDVLAADQELA